MVVKRLSCVFRLTDGCMNRPLSGSEAALYSGGARLHHEYKQGGYFVVTDLPAGDYTITILAHGYQRETARITVGEETSGSGLAHVNYIALNPSAEHPAAVRMASVTGTAAGIDTLYVVRPVGNMRVAEDSVSAGSSEIRMFSEGKTPAFPLDFVIGSGAGAEIVTFTGSENGICRTAQPFRHPHKRSEIARPLIRLQCSDGFFLLIPGIFPADKQTGRIPLKFAAVKGSKVVFASVEALPSRKNNVGELKLKGEK